MDNRKDNLCTRFDEFDPSYKVCMKTKLPQADVGVFKVQTSSDELKWIRFEKEQNLRNENDFTKRNTSYLTTCYGDSGAGGWINTDWSDVYSDQVTSVNNVPLARSVLVSVMTQVFPGMYEINGKVHRGACGWDAMLSNQERVGFGMAAIRTTYGKILRWIKEKADIF